MMSYDAIMAKYVLHAYIHNAKHLDKPRASTTTTIRECASTRDGRSKVIRLFKLKNLLSLLPLLYRFSEGYSELLRECSKNKKIIH